MSFPCFVCNRSFKRSQDRKAHTRLKADDAHREYIESQTQLLTDSITNTLETAAVVAAAVDFNRPPIDKPPAVQSNDIDHDDLPSSRDIVIDSDDDSDDEGSIVSCQTEVVDDYEDDSNTEILERVMSEALNGFDLDDVEDLFNFIPNISTSSEEPNTEPPDTTYRQMRRTLVDDEDQQHTCVWDESAGKIYGYEETVHSQWKTVFSADSPNNGYRPFNSRIDWEVAQWAVKEQVSHTAFNRLLKIPQVILSIRICCVTIANSDDLITQVSQRLGLSFSNAKSMLQQVDTIPERCGQWYTKQLSFKDRPNEHFTIRYRDPVQAIKGLWGDPAFSKDLVYKPAKIFRGAKIIEQDRIYSEMWTGSLWNAAQVNHFLWSSWIVTRY